MVVLQRNRKMYFISCWDHNQLKISFFISSGSFWVLAKQWCFTLQPRSVYRPSFLTFLSWRSQVRGDFQNFAMLLYCWQTWSCELEALFDKQVIHDSLETSLLYFTLFCDVYSYLKWFYWDETLERIYVLKFYSSKHTV